MNYFPAFAGTAAALRGFAAAFLKTGIKPVLAGMVYWGLCFLVSYFAQAQGVFWGHGKYLYYEGLVFSLGAMGLGFYASRSSGYGGWLGSLIYGLTPVISLALIMLAALLYYTLVPTEGSAFVFVGVLLLLWPAPLLCLAGGLLGRKKLPD